MIKLYYAPGSCAFVPLVCLYETGAEFDAQRIMLAEGEQHQPWFRAVSPRGRVPVLVVGDEVVSEVIAVVSYIDGAFPEARLLPSEPLAMAKAYELMSWLATSVHVTIAQLWRTERFVDDPAATLLMKSAAPSRLLAAFEEIEERIAGNWALPSGYSALDPYLGTVYRWAVRLETDMARFPRWQAHHQRLIERPAVQAALAIEAAPAKAESEV